MRYRSRWSAHLVSRVAAAFLVVTVTSIILAGFTKNDTEPAHTEKSHDTAGLSATFADDHPCE